MDLHRALIRQAVSSNDVAVSLTEQGSFKRAIQHFNSALKLVKQATDFQIEQLNFTVQEKLIQTSPSTLNRSVQLEQGQESTVPGITTFDITAFHEDYTLALQRMSQNWGTEGEMFLCRLSNDRDIGVNTITLAVLSNMSTAIVRCGRMGSPGSTVSPMSNSHSRCLQRAKSILELAQMTITHAISSMAVCDEDPTFVLFLATLATMNHRQVLVELGQPEAADIAQSKAFGYFDLMSKIMTFCHSFSASAGAA
jgi:hypothetical protein